MRRLLFLGAASAAALNISLAHAQDALEVYQPDYFERFAPQTALDMLEQVPGFSISSTGGGRGLGQGGTNVLIDGERVTSKDTSAIDILDQTPVATVVRIEVTDAASMGVTGLNGQIANVVLDRSRLSGSFEYSPEFRRGTLPRYTNGAVSISGENGPVQYTLGLENNSRRGFEEGPELVLDEAGNVIQRRDEHQQVRSEVPSVTGRFDIDLGAKTDLALTGSATLFTYDDEERSVRDDGEFRRALNSEDEWNALFSFELTRDIGPGALKAIGYQRFERSPFVNRTLTIAPGGEETFAEFTRDDDEGESIGRLEYAWSKPEGGTWELAAETAFNFLDSETAFLSQEAGTTSFEEFPSIRVEELRNQASVTRGFTLREKLDVQASVSGEWSKLTVIEEAGSQSQTFLRPRGFITIAYPWREKFEVRGRVERSVGQLRFFDFVSSVDLTEERSFEGNQDLVPQQSWNAELELQKNFGEDEKIILRLFGQLIEDRVDRILIDGTDAVGNIDEASFGSVSTEGTVLTDRWGIEGGRIDFSAARRTSQLDDPITGKERPFNGLQRWNYDFNFRHDIPTTPYAYGFGIRDRDGETILRFNEELRFDRERPGMNAFLEHKDFFGYNLRFDASNLANRRYTVDRIRYTGLRTTEPIDVIEDRERIDNRRFTITLSGTF